MPPLSRAKYALQINLGYLLRRMYWCMRPVQLCMLHSVINTPARLRTLHSRSGSLNRPLISRV